MLRVGEDEYRALQARINEAMRRRLGIVEMRGANQVKKAKTTGRKNKYGAEATEVSGVRFDSKVEAKRYLQLLALEQAGEIANLEIQVPYELIPAQDIDGRKEKPVVYVADFRYSDRSGAVIVEDTKSAPTKTREYIIKRKLMLWIHGIAVREVMMD